MADFFQTGSIATLHRLGPPNVAKLEVDLRDFSKETPIALVLPCHVKELGTAALRHIVRELHEVDYLSQIVIGIDGANAASWRRAKSIFQGLPQKPVLIWNDGPRMRQVLNTLREADLQAGEPGKGRNLWMCFGAVIASEKAKMVAAHDCDISTYSREMLARLCYPVAHPNLGFDFCKGYSARFSTKLHGRVMRLLVTPLLRSLESIIGSHPFLKYMDAFRYPLAGEVSLDLDILRRIRMPSDWGVEVGMLAEIYRVSSLKAICQADVADRYDHKHQELSARDATRGLHKMAVDVMKCVFRTLAGFGVKLDAGLFDTLMSAYMAKSEDSVRFYAADAAINCLKYDRHEEELAVATFLRSIRLAAKEYLSDPLGSPMIESWNRVNSALPNFCNQLIDVITSDNS